MEAILTKLYEKMSLTQSESKKLFEAIIRGDVDPILMASALTALKLKGETPDEIAGAANALISNAKAFPKVEYDVADIVGTGGDGHDTINISTTAAFVAAACGLKIAKHGNRSVSSKSGSSDLLDSFGINLKLFSTFRGPLFLKLFFTDKLVLGSNKFSLKGLTAFTFSFQRS